MLYCLICRNHFQFSKLFFLLNIYDPLYVALSLKIYLVFSFSSCLFYFLFFCWNVLHFVFIFCLKFFFKLSSYFIKISSSFYAHLLFKVLINFMLILFLKTLTKVSLIIIVYFFLTIRIHLSSFLLNINNISINPQLHKFLS